jgi:cellulase
MYTSFALSATFLAAQVAAHGYLKTFTLDSVDYEGYQRYNDHRDPNHIGWSHTIENEGPELLPDSPGMICRSGAQPAQSYGQVSAGGDATFLWTSGSQERNPQGWAHSGPVLTYIAPCGDDCTSVDPASLQWTKIHESGLNSDGTWASDLLRQNGGLIHAKIPDSIAPGKYVLRSEIIALHRAHINEPEFYMQCGNVEVTGSGTDDLSGQGVVATQLYGYDDKNLFGFQLWNAGSVYEIPGPPLYEGAGNGGGGGGNGTVYRPRATRARFARRFQA